MAETFKNILASWPEPSLFNFPPSVHPAPIPPAHEANSLMHPLNIPDHLFTAALDAKVPITIAAVYAISAKLLNKYNAARNKQPWAISKSRPFHLFVILHNIFLAVYSAWTFWGMLGGMRRSIVNPMGPGGMAATADSFCRLHGEGGLGSSVFYNETSGRWDSEDPTQLASLTVDGLPSTAQMGRIWNEGLAYYGWIFYLSKFYEVLDTFIILAKGKFSSTLQTYHHAGAMMCMWAGMRYMSAPIWMFVLVNSFIHAMMYTYYTLTAFYIRVPMGIKRTLTTLQITQFLVGATYAMAHSFVSYVAPVTVIRAKSTPISLAATTAEASAPTAAGAFDSIRNLIFGNAVPAVESVSGTTLSTVTSHVVQPCIATTGETFAIWLNVLYLAPLTYLFVSFFIASYVKRSNAANKMNGKAARRHSNVTMAEKAGWDAARGLEREVYGGENMVNGNGSVSAVVDGDARPKTANGKSRRKA